VNGAPRSLTTLDRVTLFICALHKAEVDDLLDSFAPAPKRQALAFAQQVQKLESSTRQARLTREFGARPDALARLRQLVVDAPAGLRSAIIEQLPSTQRALFPHLAPATAAPPAVRALAARLVREATR
jgi:hypothetical protein